MKKTIYITYDFGMKGDYEGLYRWLDENNAEERGYGLALIKSYNFPNKYISKDDSENKTDIIFATRIKKEISEYTEIGKSDRIYLVFRSFNTKKMLGMFLFGNKKQAPWIGYSQKEDDISDFEIDA